MSAKDFVSTLAKQKIDVFSLTDHNAFNAKYYGELEEAARALNVSIIYGSELNVYVDPDDITAYFHMGVYFPSRSDKNKIQGTLEALYQLDNFGNPKRHPLFSQILAALFSLETGFLLIPEGTKDRGIIKILGSLSSEERTETEIRGMQKVFGAHDNGSSRFDTKDAEHWALGYFKTTKAFETLSLKYGIGFDAVLNEAVSKFRNDTLTLSPDGESLYQMLSNYSKDFAYFRFSDWHNKEKYQPEFGNFIYGHPSLPYETLALAMADPFSRIIVQEFNLPSPQISGSFLQQLSFKINGKQKTILFSPALNAIIGQRASGKTLLLSTLLLLSNKNDTALDGYKDFKITDVSGVLYNGSVIGPGGLGSVSYVRQDTIQNIFINPQEEENQLRSYFHDPGKLELRNLITLILLVQKLTPKDTNLKSLTEYLKRPKSHGHFTYSTIEKISFVSADSAFSQALNNLSTLSVEISRLRFNSSAIDKISRDLFREHILFKKKASLENLLIGTINSAIQPFIDNAASDTVLQTQINASFKEAIQIIINNLDNRLGLAKALYLKSRLAIVLPDLSASTHAGYLFLSGYILAQNQANISEALDEEIRSYYLKNTLSDSSDVLSQIWNGTAKAKSGKHLSDLSDENFINEYIKSSFVLYEIKKPSLFIEKDFYSLGDVSGYLKNGILEDITHSSLGRKSAAYLQLTIDSESSILLIDQPEDNIDNIYISEILVPLIKKNKKTRQLIFVTHNPSIAVYGDAFSYIFASNDGQDVTYISKFIERPEDREELLKILDGGRPSFFNRNIKYGNVLGAYENGK